MNNNDRITCNRCKYMARKPETMEARYGFAVIAGTTEYIRHDCGTLLAVVEIKGTTSEAECSEKCTSATRPVCECKCSGENHGIGEAA